MYTIYITHKFLCIRTTYTLYYVIPKKNEKEKKVRNETYYNIMAHHGRNFVQK